MPFNHSCGPVPELARWCVSWPSFLTPAPEARRHLEACGPPLFCTPRSRGSANVPSLPADYSPLRDFGQICSGGEPLNDSLTVSCDIPRPDTILEPAAYCSGSVLLLPRTQGVKGHLPFPHTDSIPTGDYSLPHRQRSVGDPWALTRRDLHGRQLFLGKSAASAYTRKSAAILGLQRHPATRL